MGYSWLGCTTDSPPVPKLMLSLAESVCFILGNLLVANLDRNGIGAALHGTAGKSSRLCALQY